MSSYTNHLGEDQDLYRGVLHYEQAPHEWVVDPAGGTDYYGRPKKIYVPCGPEVTVTDIIGPYNSPQPVKAYVTRHRNSKKNLRIARIEKVTGWEEVDY